jgi:GTP-binding protein
MIPADSPDHRKEFEILRSELEQYNPELLDKRFVIAISKSDLLDEELIIAIRKELPAEIPNIFISSATQKGIQALKDLLWSIMNEDGSRT